MKILNKQFNKKFVFNSKLPSKVSGFTIVETMVAVFILAIALTALLGLTAQSLFTARYARNEITANYLAQEAADYIRNQRDSFAFLTNTGGNGWNNFLYIFGDQNSSFCYSSTGCYLNTNTTSPSITTCPSGNPSFGSTNCPLLKFNKDGGMNGFYYHSTSGTNSNFKRKIRMVKNSTNPNEVFVYITIEWLNGNLTKTRTLNFSLLNWYNY